jgi:hypothetical protein
MPSIRARRSNEKRQICKNPSKTFSKSKTCRWIFSARGVVTHAVKNVSFNIRKGEDACSGPASPAPASGVNGLCRLVLFASASTGRASPSKRRDLFPKGRDVLKLNESDMRLDPRQKGYRQWDLSGADDIADLLHMVESQNWRSAPAFTRG